MSKTFNEAQREQGRKQWDEARKRELDERLGIAEKPSDDSGRLAAALLRIEQLEREKAELVKALEQASLLVEKSTEYRGGSSFYRDAVSKYNALLYGATATEGREG